MLYGRHKCWNFQSIGLDQVCHSSRNVAWQGRDPMA
jgi:hypothetical protein